MEPAVGGRTRGRPDDGYLAMVADVRREVIDVVPPGATVLVASKGDEELFDVPGRTMLHFPSDDGRTYAGWYPESTDDVMAQVERADGAGRELRRVPRHGVWWFDFYEGLEYRFATFFDEVGDGESCRIFAVRQPVTVGDGGLADG